MTTPTLRRLARTSTAPILWALLAAAGCSSGTDPLPASFDPAVASPYGSAWTVTGSCGNGALDAGEACDDGNGLPGDGCTAGCVVETDYSCTNAAPIALANGGFNAQGASIPGATGAAISGWTVQAGNVDLLVPLEPQASWLLTAEGSGMVDLAGTAANGELRQSFATNPGQTYNLHFAYAARCPGTSPCTRTFRVDVADTASGTVLTTARFSGTGDPQPTWQIGTVFFKATDVTGINSQIRLIATDADTTNGALVDAVTLPASTCYLVPQLSCMTPESAASDLSLNGVAAVTTDAIMANDDIGNQLGAAFSTRTFAPSSFTAVARLRITTADPSPADGFALVFQNDPRGAAAIGCPGEGLGYGQQPACTTPVISPSVAVEIDTYYNAAWDAGYPNPHIAVDANGNVAHASPAVMPAFPLINATFTIWVDYNLATRTVQVFGDSGTVKPATPILVHTLTPAQAAVFDNPFYAGITGSTGGSTERQEILYYSISTTGIVDADGDGKDDRCTVCGNGYVDATGEECDDGNTLSGDGCSATCTREAGITCTGIPSTCTGRCGDGIVASTEGCDDGNTASADGCSSTCQPEAGWVCSAPPAVDTLLAVDGATQCAATGSASTANPTTLPAGRYGLFFATGAVQTAAAPPNNFQGSVEARASTDGTTWANTSITSPPGDSAAAAIGNALGNRGFFRTNGSTTWFFFPDGSCGDNAGTTSWRLRGVSLCEAVPDTTLGATPASLSNTADPSFTFTATVPGSAFECSLDGAPFAACASPKDYAGLAQGAHAFAVRAVNGAAIDPSPATWSWTIDSLVSAPVITFPADAAQVPGSPTITGTAEPGATVTVTEGVATLCTVLADPAGNWSCATALGDGPHTLLAGQVDLALNASATSSVSFTVATNLPAVALAAPTVINAANSAAYPVAGSCDLTGGDVSIQVGTVSSTTACTAGTFSSALDVRSVPDAASVAVTAAQTNVNGTGTSARATLKDTVVVAPVIAAPATGALVAANPVVTGAAEPGATVVVRDGATVLCTLTADAAGGWSCGTTLAANPYSLSASQTDLAGNPSASATVDFTVVTAPVVAVSSNAVIWSGNAAAYPVTGACASLAGPVTVTVGTVSASATCVGNGFTATLDVTSLADGPAIAVTATQTNPAGTGTGTQSVMKDSVALPPAIASPAEDSEAAVNPTLAGNAEDFATVTVMNGVATVCTAAADSKGNWSCATTLGTGSYTLTSTQVDAAGNTSGAATRSFTVVGPPVVTLGAPGPITGANVAAYPIAGTCTTGAGPVSISVGTLTPTTTPCTAGAFSGTFNATAQADTLSASVTAAQTNGAGTGTDTKSTRKDTTAAAPAVTFPTGGSTVSTTPTFTGTAEAGATVTITDGGPTVCTTTADATGAWACTTSTLAAGAARPFLVTQVDIDGNASAATTVSLTVSAAENVVTIGALAPITGANAAAYPVGGTCTVGGGDVTVRVQRTPPPALAPADTVTYTAVACTAGGTYSASGNVSGIADDSSVQVRARQGTGGAQGEAYEYTRKDTAAAAPVISVPAAAAQVTATTTIGGTAENGASVTVSEGSGLCTVTANGVGAWSCTLTLSLGAHSITAQQTDIDGNVSVTSARDFTVVGPPAVALAAPPVINAANAAAYVVSGTCTTTAGAVTVTVGSISATPACTAGAFTTTLNVSALADASSVLVGATQTNVAGTGTDTETTRKDTVVAAPAISLPVSGTVVPPSPTLSGTGEPGATVTVVRAGPVTVCTPVVDGAGNWSCATALGVGSYSLTATQLDTAGNTSAASGTHPFTVEVLPVVTLDPPAVIRSDNVALYPVSGTCTGTSFVTVSVGTATGTTPCSGTFARTLDVSAVADGASVTVTASQSNAAGSDSDSASVLKDTFAAPPVIASPASGAEASAAPTLSGTAEPNASVTVDEGGLPVCATAANGLGAWSCPTTLAAGLHSLTAVQTDALGNASLPSAPHAFTVVGAPVVQLDPLGAIFSGNAAAYPVSGSCTGSYTVTVQVTDGTDTASTTTACSGGDFATTLDVQLLADATVVTVAASQTNVAGTGSDSVDVLKDTVVAPPAIATPIAGSAVAANPSLTGTAEPGAGVTVTELAATVCTATADGAGDWSCATTLGNGPHSLTAAQTDVAGNGSLPSASHDLFVGPPAVALDPLAVIRSANVADYSVTGSCSAGQGDVTVQVGSGPSATQLVPCGAGGTFATASPFDVSAVPDAPSVSVSAGQANAVGPGSDSATTRKDTVALPPVVAAPAEGGSVSTSVTFSGTAEPGAAVSVDEGAQLCAAIADGAGDWSCTATLAIGPHSVLVTQVDVDLNASVATARAFSVIDLPVVLVDAPATINAANAGAYPVNGDCTDGAGDVTVTVGSAPSATAACLLGRFAATLDVSAVPDGATVAVGASQTNASGTGSDSRLALKDTAAPAAPSISSPSAGSEVAARPALSGTAEPGAAVTVRDGASTVCTATADGVGGWSCTPSSDLAPGAHALTAEQVDAAGNPGPASAAHSVTVVVAPTVALAAPAVIFSGNAAAYPVGGGCTGSYTVTVQVGTASTTTGCSGGTFTTTLDVSGLSDAAIVTVSASQANAAGTATDSRNTRKDTSSPAAPAIVSPPAVSEVAPNPTLSGTAEPDASVTVREGATLVCAVTADAAGDWSCTTTLAVGSHTLTATQTDTAGNTGPASANHTFTVAATPVVALDPPAVIFSGNAAAYPVSGSCTGSAAVDLDVGGVTGTAPCSAGAFSATLDVSGVADAASVAVSASQTNVVGTGSDSESVLKDTAVSPPAISSPAPGAEVTARPTVTGTAEPGAAVTVLDGAATLCTATADGAGSWSCAPAADLVAGPHSLTASQVDAAGNPSAASGAIAVTVVNPPVVVLGALTTIYSGNAAAFPVSGTCTATLPVTVSVGTAGGMTPCSGGTFSTTVDASGLPDAASVAVTAAQPNAAGVGTDAATVLKDTVAAAPPIVAPAAGASVGAGPTISGTAEPFATIAVTEGGPSICSAAVAADAAGNWSCATALGAGPHAVSAVQTDAAGNVSAATARSFSVDVALPVVALAPLDVINGANVTAYPVTGACTAVDGSVTVSVGTVTATAPCAGAGTFSATLDVSALAESTSVAVRAAQTNAGGTGADVRTTAKDTVANAPVFVSPAAGALVAPNPVVTGTAEPFAAVEVAEGATILCTVAADAAGGWSCATVLGVGPHTVTASQTDAAGNGSVASTRAFTVDVALPVVALAPLPAVNGANAFAYAAIGTCDPAAGDVTVTVGSVTDTSPCTGTFAVALDLTGLADGPSITVTAAQTNAGGTGSDTRSVVKDTVALPPAILSPAAAGTVSPGPSVSGTAEPGATVTVTEGGLPVCVATADPLGGWSCATSLGAGAHTVDAVQADLAGNGSAASSRSFTVVGALPPVALDAPAVVNAANAAAYPVRGSCGAADGDVTVQVGTASATAPCAAGRFSAALDVRAVADAPDVTVSGSQTNGSGTSTDARPTLKDTLVAAPAVLAPTEGQHVATATPALSGTAEPGAVVTVTVGGAEVGRVTADGAGDWSVTPAAPLPAGDAVASVVQQDAAGNTSAATVRSFVVDTGAAPTLDTPVAGAVLDYDRPITFAGTAAPGATVTVSIDGALVGTATANGAGQWTLTLPARTLEPGAHSATATSGGLTSAARSFTVRLPEVEMTGGGCGCQGGAGSGGWAALLLVLGAALRRRPRRVRFPA